MKKYILFVQLVFGLLILGCLIFSAFKLDRIYYTLKYDFRPEVSCVHHTEQHIENLDCPVEKGGVIVINEN